MYNPETTQGDFQGIVLSCKINGVKSSPSNSQLSNSLCLIFYRSYQEARFRNSCFTLSKMAFSPITDEKCFLARLAQDGTSRVKKDGLWHLHFNPRPLIVRVGGLFCVAPTKRICLWLETDDNLFLRDCNKDVLKIFPRLLLICRNYSISDYIGAEYKKNIISFIDGNIY